MKNLIVCPVGMKIPQDSRWKDSEHWRWINNDRLYKTLAIVYNDFEPEEGSYDFIIRKKGHKWPLISQLDTFFDLDGYEYIGCIDDDLITDYKSINTGLLLAKAFDFQYWQLSMPEDSDLHPSYRGCLQQDLSCTFSETNFIEMGSPFFKHDRFLFLIDFLKNFDLRVSWGIDKTFYDLFQCPANVVHCATIHQPVRESYYDKTDAMNEMVRYLYERYPAVLKEKYGRVSDFNEDHRVLRKFIMRGIDEK